MIRAFAKAVLVGTLAGAWLPTIFTTITGLSMIGQREGMWDTITTILYLIVLPAVLSFILVLPSAILIGLPVTGLLRGTARERPETYAALGMIAGVLVVTGVLWWMAALGGWWLAALGMFSGGITGWVWGNERISMIETIAEASELEPTSSP